MTEDINEIEYQLYKSCKKMIERTKRCCEKNHSDEPIFKEWKDAIKIFDGLDRGYAERYEKEKVASQFGVTLQETANHISGIELNLKENKNESSS